MNVNLIGQSKKLSSVASKLRQNFELWNYREVLLPAIEESKSELDKGTKFSDGDNFYLIKPDITSQILTKLESGREYKLFYLSEVLNGGTSGDWQFGVEYVGGDNRFMIAEVLNGIITALESLGIREFFVDIGSRKVWEEVTEEIPTSKEKVFRALYHRSFDMIDEADLPEEKREEIWQLFNYRGQRCEYEKLNSILETVDDERLFADFGTVRGLPYYDDLTFEIYSPKVGSPLGGGGEYGFESENSCGFAFHLTNLLEIYEGNGEEERREVSGNSKEEFRRARKLVEDGIPVEVGP
jgi:ATP phosphoribosyltransferase regulatory subunit